MWFPPTLGGLFARAGTVGPWASARRRGPQPGIIIIISISISVMNIISSSRSSSRSSSSSSSGSSSSSSGSSSSSSSCSSSSNRALARRRAPNTPQVPAPDLGLGQAFSWGPAKILFSPSSPSIGSCVHNARAPSNCLAVFYSGRWAGMFAQASTPTGSLCELPKHLSIPAKIAPRLNPGVATCTSVRPTSVLRLWILEGATQAESWFQGVEFSRPWGVSRTFRARESR